MADPGVKDWFSRVSRTWILGGGQQPFAFDAVVRESHTSELAVTDNPVETGVVVSDHAYMLPARLEIEAAVGDVWFYATDASGNKVQDRFASEAGRSVKAFELLVDLQKAAEPFDVQTGLKLYRSMVITSLTADQDASTAAILIFRASLRVVERTKTQTIAYPPRKAGKATHQASKKVSAGEKKTEPVTDVKQASAALQMLTGKSANDPDIQKAGESLVDKFGSFLSGFSAPPPL